MPIDQNFIRRRGVGTRGVDEDKALDGYTLLAPLSGKKVYLVDNDGNEVRTWDVPYRIGRAARLLPNGNIVVGCKHPDIEAPFFAFEKYGSGIYLELDPSGTIINEYRDPLGHHDFHMFGDGHLLYLTVEELSPSQAATVRGGVPESEAPGGITYADKVVEVKDGKVVWEWRAIEHLDPELFPLQDRYAREHWPDANTVCRLADGNVLVSFRSASAVIIIEKATGKVIWHLDSTVLAQQHSAYELENGNILIFDNGAFRNNISFQYSRGIEVDRATKQIVWEWTAPLRESFFSPYTGSIQRLANGNTLLVEGAFGRIIEVTHDGELVWEYINPHFAHYPDEAGRKAIPHESNQLFRASKYATSEIPWLAEPNGHVQGNGEVASNGR